jgi:hypothetical protein
MKTVTCKLTPELWNEALKADGNICENCVVALCISRATGIEAFVNSLGQYTFLNPFFAYAENPAKEQKVLWNLTRDLPKLAFRAVNEFDDIIAWNGMFPVTPITLESIDTTRFVLGEFDIQCPDDSEIIDAIIKR